MTTAMDHGKMRVNRKLFSGQKNDWFGMVIKGSKGACRNNLSAIDLLNDSLVSEEAAAHMSDFQFYKV